MRFIYKLIRLNRLIPSYRLKLIAVLICDIIGVRHLFLRLDPVNACNLKCRMCYFSDKDYQQRVRGRFSDDDLDRVSDIFFSKALQLVVGCSGEPTVHKNYLRVIERAKKSGVPFVGLTTNAQLLNSESIEELVDLELDEITVSVHGVHESSYNRFMEGAKFDVLLTNLKKLKDVKVARGNKKPALRINYTVNEENLDELRGFFDVFGDFDIDTLQIRPMADVGKTDFAYRKFGSGEIHRYDVLLNDLSKECQKRRITLLATKKNINFEKNEKGVSYALPAVLRTIHPNKVWKVDFDWRNETYREYCRRTKWRKILMSSIFTRREFFKQSQLYLTYDIDF